MACDETLRVHAYHDGELDAMDAAKLEQHLEHCADCAALLKELNGLRAQLRKDLPYHRVENGAARLAKALGPERSEPRLPLKLVSKRPFWAGLGSGIAGTAIAASLLLTVLPSAAPDMLQADLLNAHMRSLISDHLIDVASSDHHTVRPWFSAHADVSPPVADFVPENFKLVGGRQDYVDGRRASVMVYRHGAHVINVFAWASDGKSLPRAASLNGYHAIFWKRGSLDYAAVSDAAGDEMAKLERLLKQLPDPAE